MRAVELRRDLVRSVNMGDTSWVDAAGIVRNSYAESAPATMLVTPALRDDDLTLYAKLGDMPLIAAFSLAVIASAWRARRAAVRKPGALGKR